MKDLKNSGRRAFLRGVGGIALALPLLDFTHEVAYSQTTLAQYFLTFFPHGGIICNQSANGLYDGSGKESGANLWKPADPGESLVLGTHHAPLEPWRDKLLVLQGLDNWATRQQAQYGTGGHRLNNALALTVSTAQNGPDDEPRAGGESIDFAVADVMMQRNPTPFDRMHLYVPAHNYGSPYYSGPGARVSGESDPVVAFNTYFAGVTGDEGPSPEQLHAFATKRFIIDSVLDSYHDARKTVGARDRASIDAHLEHLYELESELQAPTIQCARPDDIIDADGDTQKIAELHVKIILAALRCGLTSVANLEMGDVITPWTTTGHPLSGVTLGHSLHKLQRSVGAAGDDAAIYDTWLAEVTDNHLWRAEIFRQLVEGLDDPDFAQGGNTMLDNAIMLYTSEFSEGARHCGSNMPALLAGRAGGQWNTGRNLYYASTPEGSSEWATDWSTHNLYRSILEAFGAEDTNFGNGDAPHAGGLQNLTV